MMDLIMKTYALAVILFIVYASKSYIMLGVNVVVNRFWIEFKWAAGNEYYNSSCAEYGVEVIDPDGSKKTEIDNMISQMEGLLNK